MPRVALTTMQKEAARAARERERELAQTEVLSLLLRTNRGRTGVKDKELAEQVQISPKSLSAYKRAEGLEKADFLTAKRLAHAAGCTAEDWLRAGGFAVPEKRDAR